MPKSILPSIIPSWKTVCLYLFVLSGGVRMFRFSVVSFGLLLLLAGAGCCRSPRIYDIQPASEVIYNGFDNKPKYRRGSYPSSTLGTSFLDMEDIGRHAESFSEKNGIVYTCKAGHIDLVHVRQNADWTAYLAAKTFQTIMDNGSGFSFRSTEPSLYIVGVGYPENWNDLSLEEKKRIAREVSIKTGGYLTFSAGVWHEMLTWFGYKRSGFYSELPSAFSWEDMFSNLLGTHIGTMALEDHELSFRQAVTLNLERELKKLQIQPGSMARQASEQVRGIWFSGHTPFFFKMMGRNFDTGIDDGFITPWVVPGICECQDVESYPVPVLDFSEYGFSIKFEIEPREWEKDKILDVVYGNSKERPKRIQPAIHFAPIMEHIKKTKYNTVAN